MNKKEEQEIYLQKLDSIFKYIQEIEGLNSKQIESYEPKVDDLFSQAASANIESTNKTIESLKLENQSLKDTIEDLKRFIKEIDTDISLVTTHLESKE